MILVRRAALTGLCIAVLLSLVLGAAADEQVKFYSGDPDAIDLEADEEETYLDAPALRIETKGYYEGGRLALKEPLAGAKFLDKLENGYITLTVKVHEPEAPEVMQGPGGFEGGPGGAFPGDPGMAPGMQPGMDPGMIMEPGGAPPVDPGGPPPMDPGMDPGMIDPGMMPGGDIFIPGGGMGEMAPPEPPSKIASLRLLLVTDKGEIDSGPIVVEDYPELVEDWRSIVLPLADFGGSVDLAGANILSIALFGDVDEIFYLGELTLGQEEKPLLADAGEMMTVKVDKEVTFKAAAQPDGSTADYLWDFDDLDGLQEQGYGTETTWTFLTPGYYMVTLTVSDTADRRVPRMARVRVKAE